MGDEGVQFPLMDGRRSTTRTGRDVFAAAAEVADPGLAHRIRGVEDWRSDYLAPARELVAVGGRSSAASHLISAAGLDRLWSDFRWVVDGTDHPIMAAAELGQGGFATRSFVGGAEPRRGFAVPYHGRELEGSDLRAQARRWVDAGVAEPSLLPALDAANSHPEWFDLSRTTVVVLGAGAELAPLRELLSWGAQVLAVDLPDADRWRRIIAAAEGTPGVLHVPVPRGVSVAASGADADEVAQVAGADLLTRLPDVAAWIAGFDGPVVLGNYLYADGATNVRLSVASDALARFLSDRGSDPILAFLATPTDAFQVGADVVLDSRQRWDRHLLARATRWPLRLANLFQPNYPSVLRDDDGRDYAVADCLVPQQGPNYLLAKRMQRWRAVVNRESGLRVSLNVAPATRTRSVVKNRLLAAAYAGAGRFGMEIFEPDTTNALMGALLVRDLNDPASATNPDVVLTHPSQMFTEAATHGGLWRSAFSARSVLGVAAVVGMIERAA